jgi:hypothetical protein
MCTRANRASVPESAHALIVALLALATSLVVLAIALVTVPIRVVGSRPTKHGRPASTGHIEIQVHLKDGNQVRTIEHSCRDALNRAARTWAPFVLPLDRVEVLSSAPPLGKIDIYEQWLSQSPGASATAGSLVVVSLGTATDAHELTADQIAGALAVQIERLVIDRYQREHPKESAITSGASAEPATATRVGVDAAPDATANPDNLTDIRTVREHMELIRKGLPVPPAGPPKNVTRAEPDPVG